MYFRYMVGSYLLALMAELLIHNSMLAAGLFIASELFAIADAVSSRIHPVSSEAQTQKT